MKNVHLIPTDKPSMLCIDNSCNELNYSDIEGYNSKHITNQNIYITSNEEIKEGDWIFANQGTHKITDIKDDKYPYGTLNYKGDKIYHHKSWEKIILTTDQDLIKDGVQAIHDTFLEWFVKNPSCEWVEVGYGWIRLAETDNEGYWVSIPDKQFEMQQEEPKKQIIYSKEDLKQSYSQGWMTRERFDDLSPEIVYPDGLDYEEKQEYAFNLWFEQFKKK